MTEQELHDLAFRLEEMLPRLMRTLYRPYENDPLQHLPVAQIRVLRVLFNASKSHSAVSEELGISVSAVTQVANRLESLGLVERVESSSDRRVKNLQLSEHGQKCMRERQEYRVTRTMQALRTMPESRREKFMELVEELSSGGQSLLESERKPVLAADLAQLGRFPVMGGEAAAG